jgi:hypothetical protein
MDDVHVYCHSLRVFYWKSTPVQWLSVRACNLVEKVGLRPFIYKDFPRLSDIANSLVSTGLTPSR